MLRRDTSNFQWLRVVGWLAAALLVSVATAARADVAERDWRRYTQPKSPGDSTVTDLLTDVPDRRARRLLQEVGYFSHLVDEYVQPFAELAQGIAPALAGARVDPAGTDLLEIVMMNRRREFSRLFRPDHFAAFTQPTLEKTVLVVGPQGGRSSLREHILHEYVHYRLRRDVPGGLPLWFEEGLATFLSQVRFDTGEHEANSAAFELGYSLGHWVPYAAGPRVVVQLENMEPLPELIRRRDLNGLGSEQVRRFYRTAHGFVRYLYLDASVSKDKLAQSLVLDDQDFQESTGVDLKRASRTMRALFHGAKSSIMRSNLKVQPRPELVVVDAQAPDVRQSLAESAVMMNPPAAEKLFATLAADAPATAMPWVGKANALRMQGKNEAAQKALARARSVASDDPAVLLEQAALASSGCILERRADCPEAWQSAKTSLAAALEQDPDNFEAIYRFGIASLFSGQPASAQGYLEIAWQRVPWSPRVNFFLGESLRLLGDSRAAWYLANARRWASSDFFRAAADAALESLDPEKTTAAPATTGH